MLLIDFLWYFRENKYMRIKEHPIFKVPLAHRGLHNQKLDENSMPAFEAAVKAGFGIELDVHVTADNKIVVIHDNTTTRTTGVEKVVNESTYKELKKLRLLQTQTEIPLLKDVLKMVKGRVPVLVEVKAENTIPPSLVSEVLKVVEKYPYKKMLALQAFNPYVARDLKKGSEGVPVGQLMSDVLHGQSKFVHFMYRSLLLLKVSKPDFFNYEVKYIHKRNIQRKRKRLPLITWTIDNYENQKTAIALADNYIFEHIEIKER
ncbi:MAG: cytoplasmic glycerophosphodiester phosphodiesterase [Tenericutes bacterium ADurb.Bin087]|nr:MAG: cytoplasmic glycerophosphodiester phosphodiesterase [Tenericutes bacterium ADurb.Bin087]